MADITTKSGFKCKIDDDILDNWELLRLFREIDKGDTGAIVDVAPLLLGEKGLEKLQNHLKKLNGKCRATDVINELAEILTSTKEIKN